MGGTVAGGIKARETIYKRIGKDFFQRIGHLGGTNNTKPKGFAYMKVMGREDRIRAAGQKGGRISRRGPVAKEVV